MITSNKKEVKLLMRRIVVAGGRDFDNFDAMCQILDKIKWDPGDIIISGTARGADTLGEQYASLRNIPVARFPARWDKYGKRAGFMRNEEMAQYATGGVIFWDGKSRGTQSMIFLMNKYRKPIKIVRYRKEN